MAYEVVMSYHLHMPSYFLGTFTEYPWFLLPLKKRFCKLSVVAILLLFGCLSKRVLFIFILFTFFVMNIYVGNLNYRVKENDLQKVMEDYGTVSSVKFIMDRATGRFRGIAFVEMEDSAAAAKAISELDGAEFFGRQMVVKEARPPKY